MNEYNKLLGSVSEKIKTYRQGSIPEPTPDHVDRWLFQFNSEQRLPFLREFDYVIGQTFITKTYIENFLCCLVSNNRLTGSDPNSYWRMANFLNIQQNGKSQREMIRIFSKHLKNVCALDLSSCGGEGGDFIYIDDVMFSGGRVVNDLEQWIVKEAPQFARIHVVFVALHTYGHYWVKGRLEKVVRDLGKKIIIEYWRAVTIENRKMEKDRSEVLWPSIIPNTSEVLAYMERPSNFPFEQRLSGEQAVKPFSSEAGRQILESEFLIAGAKIIAQIMSPKESMRPLGFSQFGLGFGSMIVTYRNCPNNCPLAMWWGDPGATSGALKWYPLLPREGYSSATGSLNEFTF